MSKSRGRFKRLIAAMPIPAELSPETKTQILYKAGRKEREIIGFLREIRWLIAEYRSRRDIENKAPKTALIRDGIEQLISDIDTLTRHLSLSNEATGGLLDEILSMGGIADAKAFKSRVIRELSPLACALHLAMRKAEALPSKLPEQEQSARRQLAVELAEAFWHHLKIKPTSTPGGLFETCLQAALEEADPSDPETRGLDRLARYAVNQLETR